MSGVDKRPLWPLEIHVGETVPADTFRHEGSPLRIRAFKPPARTALPCGDAEPRPTPDYDIRLEVVEVEFRRTREGWLRVA